MHATRGFPAVLPLRAGARLLAVAAMVGLLAAAPVSDALADGDAEAGRERYVERCGGCHGLIDEATARGRFGGGFFQPVVTLPLGPNLSGIFGRPAGRIDGYRYSDAFQATATGITWDAATLDRWLADSQAMIPGSYMLVRIEAGERADIIAYLERHARAR